MRDTISNERRTLSGRGTSTPHRPPARALRMVYKVNMAPGPWVPFSGNLAHLLCALELAEAAVHQD